MATSTWPFMEYQINYIDLAHWKRCRILSTRGTCLKCYTKSSTKNIEMSNYQGHILVINSAVRLLFWQFVRSKDETNHLYYCDDFHFSEAKRTRAASYVFSESNCLRWYLTDFPPSRYMTQIRFIVMSHAQIETSVAI